MAQKMRFYFVQCNNCGDLTHTLKHATAARDNNASIHRMTIESNLKTAARIHNREGGSLGCKAKIVAWDAEKAFTLKALRVPERKGKIRCTEN